MDSAEHRKWVGEKHSYLTSTLFDIPFLEGWNSWYSFRCTINETVFRQAADVIAATGLGEAGYQYGLSS